MQYNPHDYQSFCAKYIVDHPCAAVFLSCGLGKTSITLSAIVDLMLDAFVVKKVLVVAPLRVAMVSWPDEIEKWEDFQCLIFSVVCGTQEKRVEALRKKANVYIVNRENLPWLIEMCGQHFDFDMVILDELSSFKNYQSKRVKSFLTVRPLIKRVVGLTGTPSSNGLMDLFSEFKCLDLGKRLGRFITQYRKEFFMPDKANGHVVYSYRLQSDGEKRIYDAIRDMTISMKALDNLKMPEIVSSQCVVYMDKREEKQYKMLKKDLVLSVGEDTMISAVSAAALSGKLCQMANGCVYSDDGSEVILHNRKLDALEDLIEAANGNPVLVAYWFKHDRERIKKRFDVREIKDAKDIADWNNGKIPVAILHPASAGHGLNLQAGGSFLVWFGLTWSLELYQQTVARLWRQGQKNTVVVQHIITSGTIDGAILKALEKKEKMQDALIKAVKAELGGH